jgi:hypothetical protein
MASGGELFLGSVALSIELLANRLKNVNDCVFLMLCTATSRQQASFFGAPFFYSSFSLLGYRMNPFSRL